MSGAAGQSAPAQPTSLLLLLSATAGATDAIGFLSLGGLFTAHITGNIVVLASHVVTHGMASVAELSSVPVFMVALALARLLGLVLARRGDGTALDALLLLQVVLLLSFFLLGLRLGSPVDPGTPMAVLAGMCGVAAMAVQNVLVQVELPGTPTTAVLTTAVTRFTIAVVEAVAGPTSQRGVACAKVAAVFPPMVGFLAGCVAGALLAWRIGLPALMLPTFLAMAAALVAPNPRVARNPEDRRQAQAVR